MNKRLIKTIVYQVLGLIIAFTTSYLVFGELMGSVKLIFIDVVAFSVFYYMYDWVWERINNTEKKS